MTFESELDELKNFLFEVRVFELIEIKNHL